MILAQLPRADLQLEAWIASPPVRQLRALLRNRINAIVAEHGHHRPEGCWSGPGRAWLASLELPAVSREVMEDGLALIDAVEAASTGSTGRSTSAPAAIRGSRS